MMFVEVTILDQNGTREVLGLRECRDETRAGDCIEWSDASGTPLLFKVLEIERAPDASVRCAAIARVATDAEGMEHRAMKALDTMRRYRRGEDRITFNEAQKAGRELSRYATWLAREEHRRKQALAAIATAEGR
jgi:hypothetical protein